MRSWRSSDTLLPLYPANMADPGLGQGTIFEIFRLGVGLGIGVLVTGKLLPGVRKAVNKTPAPTAVPAEPVTVAIVVMLDLAPTTTATFEVPLATPALVAAISASSAVGGVEDGGKGATGGDIVDNVVAQLNSVLPPSIILCVRINPIV
jgi:hypothetical protein